MEMIEPGHRIEEAIILEEELPDRALYDALTGLPNRILFIDNLECTLNVMKRQKNCLFAVLYLDLDRFKVINDSLGHTAGDQLLIKVAQRLRTCLRSTDTVARLERNDRVARLGGDEFAVIIENLKNSDAAVPIADRIQRELETPFNLSGQEVFITASIGIALSKDYDRSEDILRDAETAMYRAKTYGKACQVVFDTSMRTGIIKTLELESELRRAIENKELRIYYQPIVSLKTGKIVGSEALVRWQHPERGLISPAEFIPIAEETGLILPIGEWTLRTACAQNKIWQSVGYQDLYVSVNCSARQFQHQDLPELVQKVIKETGMPAQSLKLEVVETTAMKNIDFSNKLLKELSAMGVRISIDDFGTGYSSLFYLKTFPINTLKIDKSFVRDMKRNSDDAAIVKAIIAMAHSLNLNVIAEGVETEEQLSFLSWQQCDEIQGFIFSRPLPAEDFMRLLLEERSLSPGISNKTKRKIKIQRLGEMLVDGGIITKEQLNQALKEQKISNEKLGRILMRLGYITEEDVLIKFLSKQHEGTLGINLFKEAIDERVANLIPRDVAEKYKVVPTGFKPEGNIKKLILAMANPSDVEAVDTVAFITGYRIYPVFAMEEHLNRIMQRCYIKRVD